MKAHPLAGLFPLLEGDGKILDGRNRYHACRHARIQPIFKPYRGKDPLAFVISMNLKRRHLNESQRAMVASKIVNVPRGGQTTEPANLPVPKMAQADTAKLLKISERSIRNALVLRNTAEPEIQRAVEQGRLTINLGLKAASLSKADQCKIATRAEAGGNIKPFFHQLLRTKDEARVRSLAPVAGKFATLVIDPPWEHSDSVYATMTQEQLLAFDVRQWARDDCALYLWTTGHYMPHAIELMAHWGFDLKNILTWVKPRFGHGPYFRHSTEFILFGIRGLVKLRREDIRTHFEAPTCGHSCKPERFYQIVRVASHPPYGEIFQRDKRADFTNLHQTKKQAARIASELVDA
jgi:N6-adenosine-specific RNA methylase IME4